MLSRFFKKQVNNNSNSSEETNLSRFEEEHDELIETYHRITELAKNLEIDSLKKELVEFKDTLITHIKNEAGEVYTFLDSVLHPEKDKSLLNEIYQIKRDVVPLRNKVNILTQKYNNITKNDIHDFLSDFQYIGKLLHERIEIEENKLFKYYLLKKR